LIIAKNAENLPIRLKKKKNENNDQRCIFPEIRYGATYNRKTKGVRPRLHLLPFRPMSKELPGTEGKIKAR
jgi:hypothetical protein